MLEKKEVYTASWLSGTLIRLWWDGCSVTELPGRLDALYSQCLRVLGIMEQLRNFGRQSLARLSCPNFLKKK